MKLFFANIFKIPEFREFYTSFWGRFNYFKFTACRVLFNFGRSEFCGINSIKILMP